MNKTLYSFTIKKNLTFVTWFVIGIVCTILAYVLLFPSVSKGNAYADLLSAMPQDMLNAIGMNGNMTNFNDYLNMNFYNSIYLYILMAFTIVFIANLIAKPIDNTSLVYYLNSPVSRKKYLITQIIVFVSALICICFFSVVSTVVCRAIFISDTDLNIKQFLTGNLVIGCVFLFLGSIGVLVCSLSKKSGEAMAYCAGIMVLEYIFDMLAKVSGKVEFLRYLTVFTIYNPDKIAEGDNVIIFSCIGLIAASAIIFIMSAQLFKQRDLYL